MLDAIKAIQQFPGGARAMIALGTLGGVVLLATYTVATFSSSDSIFTRNSIIWDNKEANYRWDGEEDLLLTAPDDRRATCAVRPDDGAERRLGIVRTTRYSQQDPIIRSWFSGPATVACRTYVSDSTTISIYLGTWAHLRKWTTGPQYRFVAFGLFAVPIGIGVSIGFSARRRRT